MERRKQKAEIYSAFCFPLFLAREVALAREICLVFQRAYFTGLLHRAEFRIFAFHFLLSHFRRLASGVCPPPPALTSPPCGVANASSTSHWEADSKMSRRPGRVAILFGINAAHLPPGRLLDGVIHKRGNGRQASKIDNAHCQPDRQMAPYVIVQPHESDQHH